jgi:beta-lactamase regulating signal transducer with metallopeptidase domain
MERIETLALTFLLNALWQVPALVLAASLADRLLRRGPARLRHALWSAALALCFLLPAASLLPHRAPQAPPPALEPFANEAAAPAHAGAPAEPQSPAQPSLTLPPALRSALTLFYGLAVLVPAVRLSLGWRRARALARTARPLDLPEEIATLAERCREAFGLDRIEILASDRIPGPLTLGALRPVILLPPEFPAAATPEELTACLGHEMAHVRRRDYALHLLGEALLVPLSFHPAVRPLRRRLAETREMACDEATVERLLGARAYARSLLSLAASIAGLPRPVFTLGVHQPDTADTLEVRMKSLTDRSTRLSARRARATLAAALLLLAGLGLTATVFAIGAPLAAATTAAADDLKPFLGVWLGSFANKDGSGGNLPGLGLEVRTATGRPEAILTMYRHLKQPDGSVKADPYDVPVYDLKVEGRSLTFRQRYVLQLPGRKLILDNAARLDLTGDNEGVLTFVKGSSPSKDLPPPPPPIPMKRG